MHKKNYLPFSVFFIGYPCQSEPELPAFFDFDFYYKNFSEIPHLSTENFELIPLFFVILAFTH